LLQALDEIQQRLPALRLSQKQMPLPFVALSNFAAHKTILNQGTQYTVQRLLCDT